jgi:glucose-1-phosphate adenylyltransferase
MIDSGPRFVSKLTRDTYALILAGGRGTRLHELTDWRAKPALYFGGKFRIIDFPLSNCINSGIRRVGVVTQYKAHSLIRHVVRGWGHFRKELGEGVEILPASQRTSENWYQGTADAVFQNIDIIRGEIPEYVLILSGDHVYRQDYGDMLAFHKDSGADMTVCCCVVPVEEAAGAYGVLEVDEHDRVIGFEEKPAQPKPIPGKPGYCLVSMGNYLFKAEFLFEQLRSDHKNLQSDHDFGKNVIPSIIADSRVYAFRFQGSSRDVEPYWRDVGTLDSYWKANIELTYPVPALNLYDMRWRVWTFEEQLPPAKFVFNDDDRRGFAVDSLVASGCIVSGSAVSRSVLCSRVRVNSWAKLEECVILPEANIGRHCELHRVILDRGCHLPEGTRIGFDAEEDRARGYRVTAEGVTLVTRSMLGQTVGAL